MLPSSGCTFYYKTLVISVNFEPFSTKIVGNSLVIRLGYEEVVKETEICYSYLWQFPNSEILDIPGKYERI